MLADASAPVKVGDVLAGKYQVERVLGMGAMGVVVAAMHLDLHELRAIKFMRPAALANEQAVERFQREARAAARLKSQHVAKVHDIGKLETGAPYIVMEFLEGTDLRSLLQERKTLSVDEVVLYIVQACEAIAEAHAAGIVHRDLKPGNLFLTRSVGGTPCVKVLDFGIAKLTAAGDAGAELTQTAAIMGTPSYMSPEQMRSNRTVDARADIWALGVILYKALTGSVPFAGETVPEVCSAVIWDTPARPSSLRPELPPALDHVVLRCLEKDLAKRFEAVADLAAALVPFASERAAGPVSSLKIPRVSLLATPTSSRPPAALPPPSTPSGSFESALAESDPLSNTGGTAASWARSPSPTRRPHRTGTLVGGALSLLAAGTAVGALVFSSAAERPTPDALDLKARPAQAGAPSAPSAAAATPVPATPAAAEAPATPAASTPAAATPVVATPTAATAAQTSKRNTPATPNDPGTAPKPEPTSATQEYAPGAPFSTMPTDAFGNSRK